jgi:hypothetical protein
VKRKLVDYKGDLRRNQEALDWIACWRCRGRVPMAVEATAEIIQLNIQGSPSSYLQRLAISMVLVRLVNGISGNLQKGVYAKSVADLAQSVGLPRILVDLRHEATHNNLPSLNILSIAADQALEWLEEHYWNAQEQQLRSQSKQIEEILARILELSIKSSQPEAIGTTKGGGEDKRRGREEETNSTKRQRAELLKELIEIVPPSQASLLVGSICSLVFDTPSFRVRDSKGWKTFFHKVCKYWPCLGILVLQQCWSTFTLKQKKKQEVSEGGKYTNSTNTNSNGHHRDDDEEEDTILKALCAFLPWFLENRDAMGIQSPGSTEQSFHSVIYSVVLEGVQILKRTRSSSGSGSRSDLSVLLTGCFNVLSSSENATAEMRERLRILDQVLHPETSAGTGPDILLLRPLPPPAVKALVEQEQQAGQKRKHEEEEEDSGADVDLDEEKEKRWKKCKRWTPCAVGNLPSVSDSNGALPFTFDADDRDSSLLGILSSENNQAPQSRGAPATTTTTTKVAAAANNNSDGENGDDALFTPTLLESSEKAPSLNTEQIQGGMKLLF